MLKVYHGEELLGKILTNHSMSIDEALELLGIDPNEMDGQDLVYDADLFTMEYDD